MSCADPDRLQRKKHTQGNRFVASRKRKFKCYRCGEFFSTLVGMKTHQSVTENRQ